MRMEKATFQAYLLLLYNTLQTTFKCKSKCFVGIDEGALDFLGARKHLRLNG